MGLRDHDLVARAAGRDPYAGRPTDRGQGRAAGEHDTSCRDLSPGRRDAGDPVTVTQQTGEGGALEHPDARREQGRGVGEDVAGRVDVAVARGVGATQRLAAGHRRVERVELVGSDPAHVEAETLLHGDPVVRLADLALGEARHEIALGDEAGVDAEPLLLAGVEVAAEETEPDGGLGAALGPDHAGRAGAGTRAEGALLDEDDVGEPGLAQEPRAPRADRAATHDDGIGGARPAAGHVFEARID